MFSYIIIVSLVCLLHFSHGEVADDLVVSLNEPKAKIRGHILKSHLGKDYYGFQDIPYAVPPVGENRFAEPKPHAGWDGILSTTENKKVCVQQGGFGTEDCLVLNVYTPVRSNSAKLPVLLWIHGGAFMAGSGTFQSTNPHLFIDYNLIVVAINYRLGPLGFLTTEDGVIPGNLGLKDQLLAMKWVNKNIEQFGGDPKKVTIAGQSAGSISCGYHIVSQKSSGLYRAAIMESGTALVHGSFIVHAKNYSFQVGKNLDNSLTSTDSKALLKVLRKASVHDLMNAASRVRKIGNQVGILTDLLWAGVVEDKNQNNAYITEPMQGALKSGQFEKVPIMLGFTSEEMISFAFNLNSVKAGAADHDRSYANLIPFQLNIPEKNHVLAGEKLKRLYTNSTFSQNLASFVSFSSDIGFVNPIVREADLASKSVPVYLFQFSYKPTSSVVPGLSGVGHAGELNYMWNMNSGSNDDMKTSQRLLKMWTNFINSLNPTPTSDTSLGIPIWPRVQPNNLQYMDIDSRLIVKNNPKKYNGVKAIFDQYIEPPLNIY